MTTPNPHSPQEDCVKCPEDGAMNDADSLHCDQCGALLPDSAFTDAGVKRVPYQAPEAKAALSASDAFKGLVDKARGKGTASAAPAAPPAA